MPVYIRDSPEARAYVAYLQSIGDFSFGTSFIWVEEDGQSEGTPYPVIPVLPPQPAANAPQPVFIGDPPPEFFSTVDQTVPKTVEDSLPGSTFSSESGICSFETIFNDFDFLADAKYNFWEPGEETTAPARGVQDLSEVARYVHLSWKQAPDLKDPRQFQKNRLSGESLTARNYFVQLSPFGFGARFVAGVNNNGVSWTPSTLTPEAFQDNAAATANGYIAPGVVEAVATVPTGSVTIAPMPTAAIIDEDDFLANAHLFEGISYSEFNAAAWRWFSSVYGVQQSVQDPLSPTTQANKSVFFDGQFSLPSTANGDLYINAVSPSGPAISFIGISAESATPAPTPRIFELTEQMGLDGIVHPLETPVEVQSVKIKFIYTNLQGLIDANRINSIMLPEQAESVLAIAPFISNLAVFNAAGFQDNLLDISIPSFPVPSEIKPLEYVGYVIEKYEQVNGSFQLVETIFVPGREYDEYFDTKVKYGAAYRYRIKAILRWSRPTDKGVWGTDITTSPTVIANGVNSIAPYRASYFEGEWSRKWVTVKMIDETPAAWPDELTVRPNSKDGYIEITMKLPYNPQRDISKMTLWRKMQDEYGNDLTGWVQIQEFKAVERQGTKMSFLKDLIHQQDDLTGVNIRSKEGAITENFLEFAPVNSRFRDWFRDNSGKIQYFGDGSRVRYVYAGLCHSRHGPVSRLSDQIAARLNSQWAKEGEYPVNFVSCAGVDINFDTGVFATYPERRIRSEIVSPANSRIEFSGQTRLAKRPLNSNTYTARIESLDNGQHIDVPINVNVENMPEELQLEGMTILVT